MESYAIATASVAGSPAASRIRKEIYPGGLGVVWLAVMISWIAFRNAILPGVA